MPRLISVVHITPDFEKAYLRLPKHIQNLATRKDQWFRKDAFDPRLRTHKLKGALSAYWAYSVNREYGVLFRFLGSSEASTMMWAPMKSIVNGRDANQKRNGRAERVVAAACKKNGVSLTELRSGSRRARLPSVRAGIVRALAEHYLGNPDIRLVHLVNSVR